MNEVIATIRLAQGRVGFYDELSRIHLSLGNPIAHVYSGTNCARLRRAVKDGVIRLVDGTLGGDVPHFKIINVNGQLKLASNLAEEMKPVVEAAKEDKAPVQDKKAEETVVEKVPTEPIEEAPVEPAKEAIVEEAPVESAEEAAEEAESAEGKSKKRAPRKKAAKKTEE